MSSKNRYRLIGNSHSGPGKTSAATTYVKGDVIETVQDLDKMFPGKFKKLGEDTDVKPTVKSEAEKKDVKATDEVDVTAKFEAVIDGGSITVSKKGKLYFIRDTEDEDAGVLNEEELTSQAKVTDFIADYLTE